MLRKLGFLFTILLVASRPGFAAAEESKKADYSKEAYIITATETHVRFAATGASQRTQRTSVKVLSEAGLTAWGVISAAYAADNQHIEFRYVRVRKSDGTVVETPLASVLDQPSEASRTAPMYSDIRQKQIPVKALGVGDTLEFELSYVEDKPLVPGQFWFSYSFDHSAVVLREVLEIRVPRDHQPKIANADVKPTVADDGAERVYIWTTAHTESTKSASVGQVIAEPEKISVQISTFASWQQVGEWYRKLSLERATVTPEIQAKADLLVKGLATDDARMQAIYDFVSTRIRYIGLSFGIGRYQPHTASEVLENEYGDCKDKHTLLAALLKAEGIEAWPVLIHSSIKLDEDVPSPAQFDHLITVVPQGKQFQWMDTTPEVAPFGLLLANLRDKQALAIPTTATPLLIRTPTNPPFPSLDHLDMTGVLNSEGTFNGHGNLTLRSDSEVLYRAAFHMSAQAKWQEVMQAVSYRLGFGGDVSNVQIDDPKSTHQPFHLAWDYQRKKFGDWDNRQILPPTGGIPINMIDEDKKPISPIPFGSPGTTIFSSSMELPAGSTITPPAAVDIKTPFAEYHAKYSLSNGKLICERRLDALKKEVPVADWQQYISFQKEISSDYSNMIPISLAGGQPPSSNASNNTEAAGLIEKAMQDLQNQQLDTAEDELDKARKLNPHQVNLSSGYGSLYMSHGKMDEAFDAFRTELKEHPDNLRVARWLGQTFNRMRRSDDALDAYRVVLKAAPDDVEANSEVGRLLVEKQNWKEAQPVLERAIKLRPDSAQVQMWYGQSCLQNGKQDEGLASLQKAADSASDAAMLATVASAITDTGKQLDLATQTAKRAVTMVEQQTASLSLESLTNPQMKKMVDLAQIWDTMSWVAFKSGDIATAERFASSAWRLAQSPFAGDHLGQIYEKQGKPAQALEVYQLVQARAYPVVPGLTERVNALRKRLGQSANLPHPGRFGQTDNDRLQNMRIVKIPRGKPLTASGDFLVLFSGGKVSGVKMLGGDAKLEPMGDALREAKFETVAPDDGPEHIVRQGILSCSVYDPSCMFLMMLPNDATATSRSGTPIHAGETRVIHVQ